MDFIKKYIKILFMLLMVMIPISSQASEFKSDCGVKNQIVEYGNGSICEEDTSFRMIYKMFPTVIEKYVFPIVKPEYIKNVPTIEKDNLFKYQSQEIVFFEIFKSSFKIAYLIIFFFVCWHFLFIGLLKTANDGTFLGSDWKTSSVFMKYGIITVLLLPVSTTGVLVFHVILLSLIVVGIYFANFFWSSYLNYMQNGDDIINMPSGDNIPDQVNEKTVEFNNEIAKYDHNKSFAHSYVKNLALIALCKERTEKVVFQSLMSMADNNTKADLKSCAVNDNPVSTWNEDINNKTNNTSFIHYNNGNGNFEKYYKVKYNMSNFWSNTKFLEETSVINFSNKDFKQCESNNNKAFGGIDYDCGEIVKTNIPQTTETVRELLTLIKFYTDYKAASARLMKQTVPNVEQEWNKIRDKIISVFNKKDAFPDKKDLKDRLLQNVSFMFHQMIMNDILIGNSNVIRDKGVYTKENNFDTTPLEKNFAKATKIAKDMEIIKCLDQPLLYNQAQNAVTVFNDFSKNVNGYNVSCLDLTTMKPIGVNAKKLMNKDSSGDSLFTAINIRKQKALNDLTLNYNDLVEEIAKKRNAVELSYYKSLLSLSSNDLIINLRKLGWASSGGFMLKLISEKEGDVKSLHALRNMSVVTPSDLDEKGLPSLDMDKLFKESNSDKLTEWFDIKTDFINLLNKFNPAPITDKNKPFIDVNEYIGDKVNDSLTTENPNDNLELMIGNILNVNEIIYGMKNVVGLTGKDKLSMKNIESCFNSELSKTGEYVCPISVSNPIVKISELGHKLIDTSLQIIIAGFVVAIAEQTFFKAFSKSNLKNKNGKVEKGKNSGSSIDISKSKIWQFAEKLGGVLNFIASFLIVFASFMLTVGMTMAYVIPLIPFVAFTIAFVSWIIISVEVLIIGPIWLAFLFRLEDSRMTSTELYAAGFNFVMQLLFRPALIVISLIIGWSLFSVIFLVINLTIAPLIIELTDSGGIFRYFVSVLLMLTSYIVILYIGIKQIFNLLISLPNKIFTKIGVTPFDSEQERESSQKLSNFAMAGVGLSAVFSQHAKGVFDKSNEERREARNKLKAQAVDEKLNQNWQNKVDIESTQNTTANEIGDEETEEKGNNKGNKGKRK